MLTHNFDFAAIPERCYQSAMGLERRFCASLTDILAWHRPHTERAQGSGPIKFVGQRILVVEYLSLVIEYLDYLAILSIRKPGEAAFFGRAEPKHPDGAPKSPANGRVQIERLLSLHIKSVEEDGEQEHLK